MSKPGTMTDGTIKPGTSRIAKQAPEHAAKAAANKAAVDAINEARQQVESAIVDVLTGGNIEAAEQAVDEAVGKVVAAKPAKEPKPVSPDAPGMVTVPEHLIGTAAAGMVGRVDGTGLLRLHKATCSHLPKGTGPVDALPIRLFASYCCKPVITPKGYDRKTGEKVAESAAKPASSKHGNAVARIEEYQAAKAKAAEAKALGVDKAADGSKVATPGTGGQGR